MKKEIDPDKELQAAQYQLACGIMSEETYQNIKADCLRRIKEKKISTTNIRIANRDDAIVLINEITSEEEKKTGTIREYCYRLERLLEALKDAIEREII